MNNSDEGSYYRLRFLVRYILKNLIFFLVPVVLLVALSEALFLGGPLAQWNAMRSWGWWRNPEKTWYLQGFFADNLFEDELPFEDAQFAKGFRDLNSADDLYLWLKNNMAGVLFPEDAAVGQVSSFSFLIGSVRIRRQDFVEGECVAPKAFGLGDLISGSSCVKYIGTLGETVELPPGNRTGALAKLAELEAKKYLDKAAGFRADFAVYNTQLRRVLASQLQVDFRLSGLTRPVLQSRVFLWMPWNDIMSWLYPFILVVCLGVYTVAFILNEMREMGCNGWKRYFADRGNWFEILQGLWLLAVCACILSIMGLEAHLGIDDYTTEFVDFDTLLNISRYLQFLFGMVFIFQTLRGIKILRLLPAVGPSIQAIGQTLADPTVLRFLVFLGWMVLGFGLGMHAIFGSQSQQWNGWLQSVVGVYRFVWGEWDVEELESVDGALSYLLFIILTFFITGTMANVFIAIVGEQYSVHLTKSDQDWVDEVNYIMSTWYGRAFVQRNPKNHKNVASRILKDMVLADEQPAQQLNDQRDGRGGGRATRRTPATSVDSGEMASASEAIAANRALRAELEVARAEIEEHKKVRSFLQKQDERLQKHDEKLEQVLRVVTANQQSETADAQPSIRI
eukprot:CAMPEP_0172888344 /NCGR_PEP_ID=MMETSP1075-20121228/136106_1 /TAXON_ID=2916 /ORGANISM="Ceratium fusus, Strain PA161109" /LENGTH=621 /DNA_ID=CAMNT_0013742197 /DNA_START=51 /DNA_END=1916 /DNA_ORIENTATION=+